MAVSPRTWHIVCTESGICDDGIQKRVSFLSIVQHDDLTILLSHIEF